MAVIRHMGDSRIRTDVYGRCGEIRRFVSPSSLDAAPSPRLGQPMPWRSTPDSLNIAKVELQKCNPGILPL